MVNDQEVLASAETPAATTTPKVEYVTDDGVYVATTAAEVNAAVTDTATRRVGRSAIQLIAGMVVSLILMGAADPLVDLLNENTPVEGKLLVTGLWTLAVVAAQNYAENKGIIPPLLKTKADVKNDAI